MRKKCSRAEVILERLCAQVFPPPLCASVPTRKLLPDRRCARVCPRASFCPTGALHECAHAQASARPPLCASVPLRIFVNPRCAFLNSLSRETKKNGFIATFPNHKQQNKTGQSFQTCFLSHVNTHSVFFPTAQNCQKNVLSQMRS